MLLLCCLFSMVTLVNGKVCKSLDVRNTPEHILEFSNCRVIQGHLKVVLIEPSDDISDYVDKSFANLDEITDYLMVYRVMGLASLKTIFPKLTSIKGENLFLGNALILYDIPHLEEIGLSNLTRIGGNIHVDRCPRLCYVDTLNWTVLGVPEVTYNKSSDCEDESCLMECKGFCWNNYQCQTVKTNTCSDLCIGCTQDNSTRHCLQCKYFNDSGTCVKACPSNKLHDNEFGRCVAPAECISMQFSVFNNSCLLRCPDWYIRAKNGTCIETIVKKCNGTEIKTFFDLSLVLGCTHIEGDLRISLFDYVTLQDLETALGNIKTIEGYLKISRSNAITSLAFFKNLTKIEGKKLVSTYYALLVAENVNLQELFQNSSNITIENGEVLIQNNAILCPSQIKNFTVDVTAAKNGELAVCNFTEFEVRIIDTNSTNVTLSWIEKKNVLGYAVFYLRTVNLESTLIRDCFVDDEGLSDYGWSSIFVQNNSVLLNKLIPFTSYSYYIKTVGNNILQSPVYGFKTSIGDPLEPRDFTINPKNATSVYLKWRRPIFINGEFSHYKLAVYMERDNASLVQQRNYCLHPHVEPQCSCQIEEELRLFGLDHSCDSFNSDGCKDNAYEVDQPRFKRSLNSSNTTLGGTLEEYVIDDTSYKVSYWLFGLQHFTLYNVFLQACNKAYGNETGHCGGSVMVSLRTPVIQKADAITNFTLRVEENVTLTWSAPEDSNSMIVAHRIEYKKLETGHVTFACLSEICQECGYTIPRLEPGKYSVRVRAVSLANLKEFSEWIEFEIDSPFSRSGFEWQYGVLVFFGVVVLVILVVVLRRRRTRDIDMDNLLARRISLETDDEWKLDDETVEIIRELGQNSIGVIYRNK